MYWNYRVLRQSGTYERTGEEWRLYTVHEVHYEDNGKPTMYTAQDVSPGGEDRDDFRGSWLLYCKALERPVLIVKDGNFTGETEAALEGD